ncbi:uncharacterized protein N7515_000984 [Penicillium bovifimosum]|uniref:Uncharacterized protein n=1 Tax=Penicillium bovifimosum TaxID=126998 RepID=A0A9W9HGE5_9EURO|nr:uncharacterized protein N7515_000984 [Penicillium bovifimosum]KAJ5146420.1 hypothetical protein N7515_000984 [Penicillium bovifimosum]
MGNDEDTNRKDSSPQDRDWSAHESNPFVAFRRYADEQVSTMLQSIIGLPSMATSPHHNSHWDIIVNDHGYKSTMSHPRTGDESDWGRSYPTDRDNASGYPADRDGDDARNHGKAHWLDNDEPWHSRSWRNWRNGPSSFFGLDSIFDRFWLEDRFSPFAMHLLHPGHNLFLSDLFEDANSPTWPIAYIMFSPYSPLHLERQGKHRSHREKGIFSSILPSLHTNSERDPSEPQWREAFEDLLRLENGKPMLNRDTPTKTETGSDWLQSLVKRGSLGDRWKFVPRSEGQPWSGITFSGPADSKQDQSRALPEKEEASADTELDLYERFLQDIEKREREFFSGASESPLLRLLLDERKQQQDELEEYRSSVPKIADDHSTDGNGVSTDLAPGEIETSVSEMPKDSLTEMETKPAASETVLPRVVSTINRTERVRLADGLVRTKIINTKRYADGREESDESVEVSHPQEDSRSDSEKSKNGWFWKD